MLRPEESTRSGVVHQREASQRGRLPESVYYPPPSILHKRASATAPRHTPRLLVRAAQLPCLDQKLRRDQPGPVQSYSASTALSFLHPAISQPHRTPPRTSPICSFSPIPSSCLATLPLAPSSKLVRFLCFDHSLGHRPAGPAQKTQQRESLKSRVPDLLEDRDRQASSS
jgi:hypothetical protein